MRRHRRWMVAGLVVFALYLALLAAVNWLGPDREQDSHPVHPTTSETPAETGR